MTLQLSVQVLWGCLPLFYAGMRQAKTKIIDSLPQLGGQIIHYILKNIYDIPGYPVIQSK